VDPAGGRGHQYFSDIDALGGKLVAVWQDNRTDDAYSVQLPIGNALDAQGRPVSSGTDVIGTYAAVSDDGTTFVPTGMVSSTTHQPSYEMFSNRSLPFQGDYNWVALAFDGPSSLFGYMGWTDNRDVRPGVDIRETDYVDGFDVFQCRTAAALEPDLCRTRTGSTRTSTASRSQCRWAEPLQRPRPLQAGGWVRDGWPTHRLQGNAWGVLPRRGRHC
jgi:hypothetical protein